jgi:hypothetical protein
VMDIEWQSSQEMLQIMLTEVGLRTGVHSETELTVLQ